MAACYELLSDKALELIQGLLGIVWSMIVVVGTVISPPCGLQSGFSDSVFPLTRWTYVR